jgi:hypothetical protein
MSMYRIKFSYRNKFEDQPRKMKIDYLKYVAPLMVVILASIDFIQPNSAQAKPIFLTDLPCMTTKTRQAGGWGSPWTPNKEDVVLGREIYTSLMSISSGEDKEFACKLPSGAKSAKLDLEVGIPSTSGGPFLLTFYLNGNEIISEKIFPGKVTLIKASLTGNSNVPYEIGGRRTLVVETTCLNGSGCGYIRFFKANLNVVGNPGGKE